MACSGSFRAKATRPDTILFIRRFWPWRDTNQQALHQNFSKPWPYSPRMKFAIIEVKNLFGNAVLQVEERRRRKGWEDSVSQCDLTWSPHLKLRGRWTLAACCCLRASFLNGGKRKERQVGIWEKSTAEAMEGSWNGVGGGRFIEDHDGGQVVRSMRRRRNTAVFLLNKNWSESINWRKTSWYATCELSQTSAVLIWIVWYLRKPKATLQAYLPYLPYLRVYLSRPTSISNVQKENPGI